MLERIDNNNTIAGQGGAAPSSEGQNRSVYNNPELEAMAKEIQELLQVRRGFFFSVIVYKFSFEKQECCPNVGVYIAL